ncbi:unnamed protein product, partial [Ectocarpus fasciculatus]
TWSPWSRSLSRETYSYRIGVVIRRPSETQEPKRKTLLKSLYIRILLRHIRMDGKAHGHPQCLSAKSAKSAESKHTQTNYDRPRGSPRLVPGRTTVRKRF